MVSPKVSGAIQRFENRFASPLVAVGKLVRAKSSERRELFFGSEINGDQTQATSRLEIS